MIKIILLLLAIVTLAFPSKYTENFYKMANEDPLNPDKWERAYTVETARFRISGGVATTGGDGTAYGIYNNTFPDDQWSKITNSWGNTFGVVIRSTLTSTKTCYQFIQRNQWDGFRLSKWISGTETVIFDTSLTSEEFHASSLELKAIGTTLSIYINGVWIKDKTDADIPSGNAGMVAYDGNFISWSGGNAGAFTCVPKLDYIDTIKVAATKIIDVVELDVDSGIIYYQVQTDGGPVNIDSTPSVASPFQWIDTVDNLQPSTDTVTRFYFVSDTGYCNDSTQWRSLTLLDTSEVSGEWYLGEAPVAITSEPENIIDTVGHTNRFKVAATNATSYQWQDSVKSTGVVSDIAGETKDSLYFPSLSFSDTLKMYRCIPSNVNGSDTSIWVEYTPLWHDSAVTAIVSPSAARIDTLSERQFTVVFYDVAGIVTTSHDAVVWSTSATDPILEGSIDESTGLFSSGTAIGGPYTVTATAGAVYDNATITVDHTVTNNGSRWSRWGFRWVW
jgi:hypothetical protein